MASAKLLAGTAYLSVDGANYLLAGEFSYNPSRVTRETLVGMDGIHGFSEKPRAGEIKGKIRDYGNLTIADINAMTNVTVTVELANGKVIVGRNMWTVEDQTADGTEATVDVTWQGQIVQEIPSL